MSLFALAAAFLLQGPAHVLETVDPTADEVAIEAVVTLPDLDPHRRRVARVLSMVVARQTQEYIRRDMLTITNGQPVRVTLMPDHLRISISVPPANLNAGLGLLDGICRRSVLDDDAIESADASLANRAVEPWYDALNPWPDDGKPATPAEVRRLYRELFKPSTVTVGVGGRLALGQAEDQWQKRIADWTPEKPPYSFEAASGPAVAVDLPAPVIRLAAPVISPGDPNLSRRLLAMIALGSGKGAAMFRVVRQRLAFSYRQEAVLMPVSGGWKPVLAFASTEPSPAAMAEKAKLELVADVKAWTEADRARALGMAQAILLRGVPFSPLYFTPNGPPEDSLAGRTFLTTYWFAKTGKAVDAPQLLAAMRDVSLEDLRQAAADLLATSVTETP